MISVHEARRIIMGTIPKPESEIIPLKQSKNRVLAQAVTAKIPMPPFTNSAMDGFAVRWEDTKNARRGKPVILDLVGTVPAGSQADFEVIPGQCSQCMTGAPLPKGSNAVVMVEHTSGFDSSSAVEVYEPVSAGQNVRYGGEEIEKGSVLMREGTLITPAETGVLASFGYDVVPVSKRPKVALIATGDELREPGQPLKRGQIYNSNLYTVAELSQRVGAEIVFQKVLKDSPDQIKEYLTEGLDTCDLVITSGGVSMGRYDFVRQILMDFGVKEHFWKVYQKPGKPFFFGSLPGSLIFGLPGNPVSVFIVFMEYVWPAIERWTGVKSISLINAILDEPFPRELKKVRFLFGQVWQSEGQLVCRPSTKTGSHMLTSGLGANCILSVEPGEGSLAKGTTIKVRLLPWKSIGQFADFEESPL